MNERDTGRLTAVARGDRDALASIYRELKDDLLSAAYHLVGDRAAAEDVLQDVFVTLARKAGEVRLTVSLRAYLVTACRNRARDVLRRNGRGPRTAPGTAAGSVTPAVPPTAGRDPASVSVAAPSPPLPPQPQAAASPAPAAPSVDPVKEQAAYQRAFNLLKEGRYEQAAAAFQAFLSEYQGGHYADNAQYWLGEAYYVTRQFEPALTEFQKLMRNYPASSKVTHAMLKVGYIYDEMDKPDKARETLKALIANHPKTTAARLAEERLRRMKQEGR